MTRSRKIAKHEVKSTLRQARVRTKPPTNGSAPHHQKSPTKAKVLVAHYADIICQGLCTIIANTVDFELCGGTSDANEALELFKRHEPRVAVVGRAMIGSDGLQFIKQLHKIDPNAGILMIGASEDAGLVRRVWKAGALGYVRTTDSEAEVLAALGKMVAHERYVSGKLIQSVFRQVVTGEGKSGGSKIDALSDPEREVLFHIGRGARISEVATQMHLSSRTVETYRQRIKEKLGLRNTAELREKAARWANKSDWERIEQHAA